MDVDSLAQTQVRQSHRRRSRGTLSPVEPANYIDRVEIARGGMGRILSARDRRLGRAVAIKELRSDCLDLRARFEREAILTARLQHPSIVSIHEAGVWDTEDGTPFYAMVLVPGRSFDRVIAGAPTLAARLALVPHVLAVADALAYAHQQHVIHRDLKPHNVLVGDFGETVVIDWGLAKDLAAHDHEPHGSFACEREDAGSTIVGDILGTPAYMPPEQASGDIVDERADVYAIGALLYQLLSGRPPYEGSSPIAVLARVIDEAPPPLVETGVPPGLLAIVRCAMARDPDDRYADAGELADELRRFQSGSWIGYAKPLGLLTAPALAGS